MAISGFNFNFNPLAKGLAEGLSLVLRHLFSAAMRAFSLRSWHCFNVSSPPVGTIIPSMISILPASIRACLMRFHVLGSHARS